MIQTSQKNCVEQILRIRLITRNKVKKSIDYVILDIHMF